MADFLRGFLPVIALGASAAFALFVRHFIKKELRRRQVQRLELSFTDNAGAEEGARINHREVTK